MVLEKMPRASAGAGAQLATIGIVPTGGFGYDEDVASNQTFPREHEETTVASACVRVVTASLHRPLFAQSGRPIPKALDILAYLLEFVSKI